MKMTNTITIKTDHKKTISKITLFNEEKSFAVASCDSNISIWDFNTETMKWYAKTVIKGHTDWVNDVIKLTN